MILDRTIAPPSQTIEQVSIPKAEKTLLDNQIPVFMIKAGEQPVMRLELIFDAGSRFENKTGESFFAAKMLSEGTSKHTATGISEHFDSFGAFLEISQAVERLTITVHGLTRHLPELLPLLLEMITDSVIPESELQVQKNITSQNLKINLEKSSYVAGQVFREQIYGVNHPYGKSLTLALIDDITRNDVTDFYEKHIKGKGFKIFISGKFGNEEVQALNRYLGRTPVEFQQHQHLIDTSANITHPESILVERTENLQSSIRLGKKLFGRTHPDYFKFMVTNTVFGGYFGSRLMKNIREEKGFTYGISSGLVPQKEGGYLVMGTDVKKEFTQQTLDEILKEINLLQTVPVEEEELETAKNYMIGSFVGSLNTPFEIADRQKIIILDDLPADFYDNYIQKVRAVTPMDVLEMANTYFKPENLFEVVVGGK
ncbi:pitrilysin family protein [Emticicia sp. TH156]|uniref:M16 family metallopeptidase n=1 Tax=Emticicia sp. TH156 TaxID=2067454 RepID=UPI000C756AD6|nr:pitrilysin family protein [Emticicia sp. TH156]PLK45976.1 peptidase M16 [Emticicia sp. TH156]